MANFKVIHTVTGTLKLFLPMKVNDDFAYARVVSVTSMVFLGIEWSNLWSRSQWEMSS